MHFSILVFEIHTVIFFYDAILQSKPISQISMCLQHEKLRVCCFHFVIIRYPYIDGWAEQRRISAPDWRTSYLVIYWPCTGRKSTEIQHSSSARRDTTFLNRSVKYVLHSEKWSSCLRMNFLLGETPAVKTFLLQGNETIQKQPGCESSCTKRILCLYARISCVSNGGMIFWALGPRNDIFKISLNWLKNGLKHVFFTFDDPRTNMYINKNN